MRCEPANTARGEVSATLGGQSVRLCVTLGALAQLEAHFGVRGFTALGQALTQMGAQDVCVVLSALALDDLPPPETFSLSEAVAAIVAAVRAMTHD